MYELAFYWPGDSFWHRLDPFSKILAAFFICLLLIRSPDPLVVTAVVAMAAAGLIFSQVPAGVCWRGIKGFLIIIAASMAFSCIAAWDGSRVQMYGPLLLDQQALAAGGMLGARIFGIVVVMLICSYTTSPVALIDAAGRMFKPLEKIGLPVGELQMIMYIAYRFLPLLMAESQKIREGQACRGIVLDSGGPVQRLAKRLAIIVPLLLRSFVAAEQLAESMEARGYAPGQARGQWHASGWKAGDYAAIILSIVLFLGLGLK